MEKMCEFLKLYIYIMMCEKNVLFCTIKCLKNRINGESCLFKLKNK